MSSEINGTAALGRALAGTSLVAAAL